MGSAFVWFHREETFGPPETPYNTYTYTTPATAVPYPPYPSIIWFHLMPLTTPDILLIQRMRRDFPRHEGVLALCELVERNVTHAAVTLQCPKCNATREKGRERVRRHRALRIDPDLSAVPLTPLRED